MSSGGVRVGGIALVETHCFDFYIKCIRAASWVFRGRDEERDSEERKNITIQKDQGLAHNGDGGL